MMKANKEGTLHNATMNYFLGPTFLEGLVFDVYPFRAPSDCNGKKWFEAQYGRKFVEECEAITLEFILAVSRHSTIKKFVSIVVNPRRLMNEASSQFPSSHNVSTSCCHPHSAIQWGIDLKMASLVTGLTIRSSVRSLHSKEEG
jgi:hypothetical protein